jgi:AraC-like DNA-binding protein
VKGNQMHLSRLIALANRYLSEDNQVNHAMPGLSVLRREKESDIEAYVYDPVICLVLQGGKAVSTDAQTVEIMAGEALLVSHHLPVTSRITRASAEEPYLALILALDLGLVRGLYEQVAEAPLPEAVPHPLSAGPADPAWLAPLERYLGLVGAPLDAKVLGPATSREIHYRLLLSPIGAALRPLLAADSHASRIARAIHRMRSTPGPALSVAELTKAAGMSASSFHEHFKSATGTTPLQYQKDLRLIAARSLLTDHGQSVAQTAFAVGYESPTHFSRDYARKFGLPPSRDAAGGQR